MLLLNPLAQNKVLDVMKYQVRKVMMEIKKSTKKEKWKK